MTDETALGGATFAMLSASDLLQKLRVESHYVWGGGIPPDVQTRTYAILNCALTAWQLKDWVFAELKLQRRLDSLHRLAKKAIRNPDEFGRWLCDNHSYFAICHQIATATKHFSVDTKGRLPVRTFSETRATEFHDSGWWTDLVVQVGDDAVEAEDMLMYVCAAWNTIFRDLDLLASDDPLRTTQG